MIKCNFIGRLGADMEKFEGTYGTFFKCRVATDDYDSKAKERTTTWVNVRIDPYRLGNMAPTKGSLVQITGTLRASVFHSEKTNDYLPTIDVVADSINFVNAGRSSGASETSKTDEMTTGSFESPKVEAPFPPVVDSSVSNDDDLPF